MNAKDRIKKFQEDHPKLSTFIVGLAGFAGGFAVASARLSSTKDGMTPVRLRVGWDDETGDVVAGEIFLKNGKMHGFDLKPEQ